MIFYIAKLCTFTLQSCVLLFCHKQAQTHAEKRRTPKVVQEDIYQDLRDLSRFYQEV